MAPSLRSIVTFAAVSAVAAFAPPASRVFRVAPRPALAFPSSAIPRALNPFDWSVDRPPRYRVEGQDLFRQLGVSPDSNFDEIKEAVAALKVKYAKEPKKVIKAEVAQDKIMELRLRQASRGQLAKTGGSTYADSVTRLTDESLAKRKTVKPPGWTKGLVKVTSKAKFLQSAKWIFGMAFAGSAVLPGFNGAFLGLIIITGANTLYKNNRPKPPQAMEDMPRTTDFPSYGEFVKIAVCTFAAAMLGFGTSEFVAKPFFIPKLLSGPLAADRVAIWCFATTSMMMISLINVYPKGVKALPKKKKAQ